MTTTPTTPREIDEALAAEYHQLDKAVRALAWADQKAQMAKGTRVRGGYGTDKYTTTTAQAWQLVADALAAGNDEYVVTLGMRLSQLVADRDARRAAVDAVYERIAALDALYTGWSRFHLVTSSAGHVHSSMHCSTCRPTTTYGWLPELSDASEAQAVEQLGAVLCSVCFPSAPVASIGGKITKAKAAKLAA